MGRCRGPRCAAASVAPGGRAQRLWVHRRRGDAQESEAKNKAHVPAQTRWSGNYYSSAGPAEGAAPAAGLAAAPGRAAAACCRHRRSSQPAVGMPYEKMTSNVGGSIADGPAASPARLPGERHELLSTAGIAWDAFPRPAAFTLDTSPRSKARFKARVSADSARSPAPAAVHQPTRRCTRAARAPRFAPWRAQGASW